MSKIHFCSGLAPEWYKPFEDDPGEFNLRPMSSLLHMEIAQTMAEKRTTILPEEYCERILMQCVIGWRNVKGLTDEDMKLPGFGFSIYRLLKIDFNTLRMIIDRILAISVLNQEEKKT